MGCRQCNPQADQQEEVLLTADQSTYPELMKVIGKGQSKKTSQTINSDQKRDYSRGRNTPLHQNSNNASPATPINNRAVGKINETAAEDGFRPRASAIIQQEVISITQRHPNQQRPEAAASNTACLEVRQAALSETVVEFPEARMKHIEEMVNKNIRTVKEDVLLPDSIGRLPFSDRGGKFYIIQLDNLHVKCQSLPSWWIYAGQWDGTYPQGIGKIYHKDFTFQGYFHKGVPHLYGRYVTLDDVYEGDIVLNVREGFGRLVTRSHYFYEGHWSNGQRNGRGFEIHKSGFVFEGLYEDNQIKHGDLYMPKGDVKKQLEVIDSNRYLEMVKSRWKERYTGGFRSHRFEGMGTYVWGDKRTYTGEWSDGKMNGRGYFVWPNGKSYEGEYLNNKKHGYGVFIGGTKEYHGEWSEGLPHGRGKLRKGTAMAEHLWWHGKIVDKNPSQDAISLLSSQDVQKFDEQNRVMEILGV